MADSSAIPIHVVVFPFPAQGHISPALEFSTQLASRGLCITFLHIHDISSSHLPPSIRLLQIPQGPCHGHSAAHNLPALAQATEQMASILHDVLLDLLQQVHQWPPPCCIVTDVFLGWTQDVADKLRLPRFILFTPPTATLLLMLHLPSLLSNAVLPLTTGKSNRDELLRIQGLTPTLRISDIPSHLLQDPTAFMYGYFIRHASRIRDASGVLLNTFRDLEPRALDAARLQFLSVSTRSHAITDGWTWPVVPVGPLISSKFFHGSVSSMTMKTPEEMKCFQWLEQRRVSSVVYVSFGSIALLSDAQIVELALGLEASEQSFIWVMRTQSTDDVLPPGFRERMREKGIIMSWAPQLQVLSHPSTGAFLSHCGWNSTLESIAFAVPLLSWPIFAEQKMNCRYLVDEMKVAIEICKGEDGIVRRQEVERAVRCLMEEEKGTAMKARVKELRQSASNAVSVRGNSCTNLDLFVQKLKESKSP